MFFCVSNLKVPSLCGVWWQCILQPLEASECFSVDCAVQLIPGDVLHAVAVPLTAADEEECDESLKMFYK